MLDYLCVSEDNQTLVSSAEGMLFGIVRLLHNSKSTEISGHALKALNYLSSHAHNRFSIAREPGLMDEIIVCLSQTQPMLPYAAAQVLYNVSLLKENVPVIANNTELRKALKYTSNMLNEVLPDSEQVHNYAEEVLQLIQTYDGRLDSKVILNKEGFYVDNINVGKNNVCSSMVQITRPKGASDQTSSPMRFVEPKPTSSNASSPSKEDVEKRRREARKRALQKKQDPTAVHSTN